MKPMYKSNKAFMRVLTKQLITLILMVTIQVTFMQKVIASVPLFDTTSSSAHCDTDRMNMDPTCCADLIAEMAVMKNCQSECQMMSVVLVTHFIEHQSISLFSYTQVHYPTFVVLPVTPRSTSLYRPPLFTSITLNS